MANHPTRPRLHLDGDTSIRALYKTLRARGQDVTRTPNDWMPEDAAETSVSETTNPNCSVRPHRDG